MPRMHWVAKKKKRKSRKKQSLVDLFFSAFSFFSFFFLFQGVREAQREGESEMKRAGGVERERERKRRDHGA